jgi:hypothetical protein
MYRTPTEERLVDDVDGLAAAFVDDADDAWDTDDASFDDDDVDVDEAACDDRPGSDWPRGAVDACAPEGAFDA